MNITSKSRYALKILMDLAEARQEITHRGDIAIRQGIPLDYMDQILGRLREAGMIGSTRGRSGGYKLLRPAATISVLEIFTAVEDAFEPVQCLDGGPGHAGHAGCSASPFCSSKDAWGVISSAIRQALSGIILSDIVSRKVSLPPMPEFIAATAKPQECRAPRRRSGAEKTS